MSCTKVYKYMSCTKVYIHRCTRLSLPQATVFHLQTYANARAHMRTHIKAHTHAHRHTHANTYIQTHTPLTFLSACSALPAEPRLIHLGLRMSPQPPVVHHYCSSVSV